MRDMCRMGWLRGCGDTGCGCRRESPARLVAVVRREGLAAGGEVRARRGALRARQRGGRGGRRRGRRPPSLTHVARFPHGRSYNTPNTELFKLNLSNLEAIWKGGGLHSTDSPGCRGLAGKELNV